MILQEILYQTVIITIHSIAAIPTTKTGLYKRTDCNCFHGSCIKVGGLQCALVNRYCIFKD